MRVGLERRRVLLPPCVLIMVVRARSLALLARSRIRRARHAISLERLFLLIILIAHAYGTHREDQHGLKLTENPSETRCYLENKYHKYRYIGRCILCNVICLG